MTGRLLWILASAALGLMSAGCGLNHQSNVVLNLHRWQSGPYRLTLGCNDTPRQLDDNGTALSITDDKGNPVTGCRVTIDLAMPSMSMPKNEVALTERKPGFYGGDCRYTMAGTWKMSVNITRAGALVSAYTLPINVK